MARAEAVVRVILVGRTGLDVPLRRQGGVELIRAKGPLEAIGELADTNGSPSAQQTVVIVATDSDRAAGENLGTSSDELVDGMRLVDPHVRVLLMLPDDKTLPTPAEVAAYDGFVVPMTPVEELMRAIRGTDAVPGHAGQTPPTPGGSSLSAFNLGDAPVVTALLHGENLLPTAIQLIELRLGVAVQFIAGAQSAEPGAAVAVSDTERIGTLVAPGIDPAVLETHATWLAGWLRLQLQQTQLRRAAFTDSLTGAWNRRYFDRFLASAIEQAKTNRSSLTLLVFDIDDFRKFNEQYGHTAADEILIETVRLLRSVIRPTDRVCRIGGDEFAVIFYEPTGPRTPGSMPPTSVAQLADRFQKQICEKRFPKLGIDAPGVLTISGGLATYPWDGGSADELVRRADELACQSKKDGKNAIRVGPGK